MNKKPIIITAVVAAAVIAALLAARHFGLFEGSSASGGEAYVMPVADLAGISGSVDRFSGVVESQETWSVDQNQEYTVKDIYVKVGDEVKEGDPLFVYDEEKFQSDLSQAQIDLERLNTEKDGIDTTIAELTKDKSKAPASEQANYTIQIQQQELEKKQKELDIKSKQIEIDKLNANIANATVTSGIDGIVQSVRDNTQAVSYGGEDTSFIRIMRTGDLRIKGKVNEQNIGQLYEGMPITAVSRVDGRTWNGTITRIDRENKDSSQNNYVYDGDRGSTSTSYPFYVDLESCEGLMLGQHVYLKQKAAEGDETPGIWLDSVYVDETDPAAPFVWADDGSGRLKKKSVVIGARDDEMLRVKITDGLTAGDLIAFPDETLREGMTCVNAADLVAGADEGGDIENGGNTENGLGGIADGGEVVEEVVG